MVTDVDALNGLRAVHLRMLGMPTVGEQTGTQYREQILFLRLGRRWVDLLTERLERVLSDLKLL